MYVTLAVKEPMLDTGLDLMLSDPSLSITVNKDPGKIGSFEAWGSAECLVLEASLPRHARDQAIRKAEHYDIPVIVIAASEAIAETFPSIDEMNLLITPFHRQDLVTTLNAVTRNRMRSEQRLVEVGAMSLDLAEKKAFVEGETLPLTRKEYEVLEYLALRKGTTISKDMFLNHLYGGGDEPEVKIIDVFVCKIRRKIKALTGGDPLIDTVWGRGYVLNDPEMRPANVADSPARKVSQGF